MLPCWIAAPWAPLWVGQRAGHSVESKAARLFRLFLLACAYYSASIKAQTSSSPLGNKMTPITTGVSLLYTYHVGANCSTPLYSYTLPTYKDASSPVSRPIVINTCFTDARGRHMILTCKKGQSKYTLREEIYQDTVCATPKTSTAIYEHFSLCRADLVRGGFAQVHCGEDEFQASLDSLNRVVFPALYNSPRCLAVAAQPEQRTVYLDTCTPHFTRNRRQIEHNYVLRAVPSAAAASSYAPLALERQQYDRSDVACSGRVRVKRSIQYAPIRAPAPAPTAGVCLADPLHTGRYYLDTAPFYPIILPGAPTAVPTAFPTAIPTTLPTTRPTALPTLLPTTTPTTLPTTTPTAPTAIPTTAPTALPTLPTYRLNNNAWTMTETQTDGPLVLGVKCISSSPGTVTQIMWNNMQAGAGFTALQGSDAVTTVGVWSADGTLMASFPTTGAVFSPTPSTGMNVLTLSTPVAIAANVIFYVTALFPRTRGGGAFPASMTSGPLTLLKGVYKYSSTYSFIQYEVAYQYGVDFSFAA